MNKRLFTKIIPILIAALLLLIVRLTGAWSYLTLDSLRQHGDVLEQVVGEHYAAAVLGYVLFYVVSAALCIPDAAVLTLSGGFLFGTIPGAIYSNAGATSGALAAFLISRYVIGDWLQRRYAAQLQKLNNDLERNGYLYLLTLRFIVVVPFFLINLLAGLTRIRVRTFIWTTSLGILPGDVVYTFAGNQLNTIRSVADIFTGRILAAFLLLAAFTIVPLAWRKVKIR